MLQFLLGVQPAKANVPFIPALRVCVCVCVCVCEQMCVWPCVGQEHLLASWLLYMTLAREIPSAPTLPAQLQSGKTSDAAPPAN